MTNNNAWWNSVCNFDSFCKPILFGLNTDIGWWSTIANIKL